MSEKKVCRRLRKPKGLINSIELRQPICATLICIGQTRLESFGQPYWQWTPLTRHIATCILSCWVPLVISFISLLIISLPPRFHLQQLLSGKSPASSTGQKSGVSMVSTSCCGSSSRIISREGGRCGNLEFVMGAFVGTVVPNPG